MENTSTQPKKTKAQWWVLGTLLLIIILAAIFYFVFYNKIEEPVVENFTEAEIYTPEEQSSIIESVQQNAPDLTPEEREDLINDFLGTNN